MPKKPGKPGLKKDGSSLPSQLGRMKQLQAKVTGNTKNKAALPDNSGEARAQRELTRIGKSMGIGDSADVLRYLRRLESNSKSASSSAVAKRVASQRASDKKTMPPKKAIKKK